MYICMYCSSARDPVLYIPYIYDKTFGWENLWFVFNCKYFSREVLLNKLFYRFHVRRDNLALGKHNSFPREWSFAFQSRKLSHSKVLPYTV